MIRLVAIAVFVALVAIVGYLLWWNLGPGAIQRRKAHREKLRQAYGLDITRGLFGLPIRWSGADEPKWARPNWLKRSTWNEEKQDVEAFEREVRRWD